MLVKGKISAIYPAENKISVILPEYDNAVTAPLPIYGGTKTAADYAVNEFLIVEVFNNNLSNLKSLLFKMIEKIPAERNNCTCANTKKSSQM